jgi:prepilin-type N-terminal cleavage/methylation domain-containing protein
MKQRERRRPTSGFTLVEVLVGVTLITVAILGLTKSGALGMRMGSRSRSDAQTWGDTQQIVDSLMSRNAGVPSGTASLGVVDGQQTVRGRLIKWTVTWPGGVVGAAPQMITIAIPRTGYQNRLAVVTDTVIVYLSKTAPGS